MLPLPRRKPIPEPFTGEMPDDQALLQMSLDTITKLLYGDSSDPISWDGTERAAKKIRSILHARLEEKN